LGGFREELQGYQEAIHYFYNVFCPTYGLTEEDVDQLKAEYKNTSVGDYYAHKGKETLTDFDIFNRTWKV
jgi:hypothetical protein